MTLHTVIVVATLWLTPMVTCPVPPDVKLGGSVDFSTAFDRLMEWEGGGQLHRDTRGILTKWGVAESAHPDVDVENLTRADAMRIARELYWKPSKAYLMPAPMKYALFDMAYNTGTSRAVRTLQRALNDVVLARGYDWEPLMVDGMPGPNTQVRAWALRGDGEFVQRCFVNRRADFYTALVERDPDEYGSAYNGLLRRALEAT